jgi:hypothetical protein
MDWGLCPMVRRRKGVLAPDEETVMGECGCGVCADGRGLGCVLYLGNKLKIFLAGIKV